MGRLDRLSGRGQLNSVRKQRGSNRHRKSRRDCPRWSFRHQRKSVTHPRRVCRESGELSSEYIQADVTLIAKLGWTKFVQHLRSRSDFAILDNLHHPAKRLLKIVEEHLSSSIHKALEAARMEPGTTVKQYSKYHSLRRVSRQPSKIKTPIRFEATRTMRAVRVVSL
eukprot:scaffold38997_cov283-Skeletonema_dohrnii-CCMP3373.AAC.1